MIYFFAVIGAVFTFIIALLLAVLAAMCIYDKVQDRKELQVWKELEKEQDD